jgi:hypothetical protein
LVGELGSWGAEEQGSKARGTIKMPTIKTIKVNNA